MSTTAIEVKNGGGQFPMWVRSVAWVLGFLLTIGALFLTTMASVNARIDNIQKEMDKKIDDRNDKLVASIERLRIDMYGEFKDLRKDLRDKNGK